MGGCVFLFIRAVSQPCFPLESLFNVRAIQGTNINLYKGTGTLLPFRCRDRLPICMCNSVLHSVYAVLEWNSAGFAIYKRETWSWIEHSATCDLFVATPLELDCKLHSWKHFRTFNQWRMINAQCVISANFLSGSRWKTRRTRVFGKKRPCWMPLVDKTW